MVSLTQAQAESGLVDESTVTDTATIDDPLQVWNFTLTEGESRENLSIQFSASASLSGAEVAIQGPETYNLSRPDLTEIRADGNYTYTTEFNTPDGEYHGALVTVSNDETVLNPDSVDNTSINARFNVTNLSASGRQSGPLVVNFTATDPVETVAIDITGPENTSLGMDAFALNDSDETYVYTGSYNASTPGNYSVRFQEATTSGGLVDTNHLNATATIDAPLRVSNFTLTNSTTPGTLVVDFQSSASLDGVAVDIQGPTQFDLSRSNFTETSTGDDYTYRTEFNATEGTYNGTLRSASSETDVVTPDYSETTTVLGQFNVTNLTASSGTDDRLSITFTATDPVKSTTIDIAGAENTTLGMQSFTTNDSNAPYVYNGSYTTKTSGEYRVMFERATSIRELVDSESLTATATIDEELRVWNLTLTDAGGALRTSFTASQPLTGIRARVDGGDTQSFSRGNFSETASNGNYTYTTQYRPNTAGNYTATLSEVSAGQTSRNPDLTATAAIPPQFDVRNLTASVTASRTISVTFDATDRLSAVTVDIGGADSTSLPLDAFATNDSTALFEYTGTYNASTAGNYTITLVEGTSQDGQDDTANITDTVHLDERLNVTDLQMTSVAGNLSIQFNATEELTAAPVTIRGPTNQTLEVETFVETTTNDKHHYETRYQPSANGNYTAALDTASDVDGATWAGTLTANATLHTRPLRVNVTLQDQTDGNGIVNATDHVRLVANISDTTAHASVLHVPFGNSTQSLTPVGDNTFVTNTTVGNLTSGRYTARVRATGPNGQQTRAESNSIMVDTVPPVANMTVEETVAPGTSTRLTANTVTDNQTQIVAATWQVDGTIITENATVLDHQATAPLRLYAGTTPRVTSATTTTVDVQNATYTFEDPGTHTVALTVEDAAGNTNRDTATVTVTEDQTQQPPTTTVDETTVSTTTSSTTDDYTGGGGIIPSSPSTETSTTTTPAQTTTPATSNTTTTNTPQTTTTVDQTASTESVEPTSRDRSAATSTGMPTGSALDEGGVGGRGESSPITVRINWVFGLVVGVVGFLGLPLYYLKTGSLIPSSLPVPLLFWMRDEEDEADENDDEDESGPRE